MRVLLQLSVVAIMIAAPVSLTGAADEKPADGDWTKLFAKEDWYKNASGKEQTFKGKLEAIPDAGGITTLQRTSYYRLGDRTIYTGARKVPALDKLVGKQVEMLGKPVNMQLEGQFLKEIWPAAVRPAPAADKKED